MTHAQATTLTKRVQTLHREVALLRSFLIGVTHDPEGDYRQSFVKTIRRRTVSSESRQRFLGKEAFLAELKKI
ncbi:MAG: hypothetical protein A3C90_04615 [Candidatus Magasanikbacteria bacterium RIFCSPHIGHO2_02_FULL_51_14]|uniref:Uncharacterized protein n=1 Tax=Candidatus Magasanikbacteria bacterium RIFCSPHIGHO2_02_FULL_51_14 TaxID=1798683 RepID=A0A1F6MQR3_9BACT|nr:MAG: hypothetical protein A3C90_04615 [Candidatus Magasanikbacteria bacterium RIFCSPHIGHO2_02_FULL_51_14]